MTTTTTTLTRRRTTHLLLLLLLAVYQQRQSSITADAHLLRRSATKQRKLKDDGRPLRVQKVPSASAASDDTLVEPALDVTALLHHPRDLELLEEPEMRVVGGNVVTNYSKHPYFAEWHNQFCGGALIHDDLVLTAAHCDNAGNIAKNVYFKNIRRAEEGSVIRGIAAHVTHPSFNAQYSTRDYDYLLLKLESSALVDEFGNPTGVEIIPINTDAAVPAANDALWGIGFGQVGENIAGMSPVLKDATIYAFANQTCERQYQQYFEEDYMFCSGVTGGGTDTCQGDSGGPIVHQATGTLVGVVSFGIGCARPNYAGVNSRVSAASDWLIRSMCEWSNYPKCNGSYAPTPAPTPSANENGSLGGGANNNNPGSITITITYDDYPEEVSWGLLREDNPTKPLKFQPWKTITTPKRVTTDTFGGLRQGITYSFKVSDSEGDGICCGYSAGSIVIKDNVKGTDLWTSNGNFGPYYEIEFEILANGHAKLTHRGAHYKPSTWPDFESMMAPLNEPFWPGRLPVANVSTIMVNVDTDDYPEELSWSIHRLSNNNPNNQGVGVDGDWVSVRTWSGSGAGFRELISTELTGLSRGWYRFIVRDSEGDGNCCQYGTGYVTLTGPLAVQEGTKGLVWGNDGVFWGLDTVYFLVDNSGYISHISKTEATVTSRTIQQQEEP